MEAPMPPPQPALLATAAAATASRAALPAHARTLWRSRLGSGLRAALACAIVGFTAVYSPPVLRHRLAFAAFSYVSAILISGEATLGDTLHGVACTLAGSVPGVLLAVVITSLIKPAGLSVGVRTLAVVLSSLLVGLLEFLPVLAKRVALGQIILIYVAPLTIQGEPSAVWQPVHVAASTALGVVASLLAMLLPYPRLACREVTKKSRLFTDTALERLRLFVNAFRADDSALAVASFSRAKWLSETGEKLLQSIKMKQAGMEWENPRLKLSPATLKAPSERLQAMDTPLKGMDLALASIPSFPVKIIDEEHRDLLLELEDHISQTLKFDKHIAGEETVLPHGSTLQTLRVTPPTCSEDLPPLFFLFCMKLLCDESTPAHHPEHLSDKRVAPTGSASSSPTQEEAPTAVMKKTRSIRPMRLISRETLMAALKCSFSMGLAVCLGLLFNKDNGYWSGLAVAVVMTPGREATFKLANARAQGTALGTVYGVLGALISRDFMWLRILVLLPWIVFTSFLRRSRMYGHAGGICAALSAIMILGRRYGDSSDAFAITRLTETCIGLSCSILVELLLHPTRASSLARTHLSQSIRALHDCINSVESTDLREKGKMLRGRIGQLKKSIGEADGEPNFWFLPFPKTCYNKLQSSLCKMGELILFMGHGLELLKKELYLGGVDWDSEVQDLIKEDVESFKKVVGSLLPCFEDAKRVKTLQEGTETDGPGETSSDDLEMGESPTPCPHCAMHGDAEATDKIIASFLRHAKDVLERVQGVEGDLEEACRRQVALCMAAVGFCMGGSLREAQELRKAALELVQRENPPNDVRLYEIPSKA